MHRPPSPPRTLCLAGVGNIGSQFIDQLARLPGLERVIIVDRDSYEASNLSSQAITSADVGRPKAQVQARRLRQLNPQLQVEAVVADLDTVPAGLLHGMLVVGCLDSVSARLRLSELAWRVGARLLDGGVNPEAGLVRVTGFRPGPAQPCYACALNEQDFRALGAHHPCEGGPAANAPTHGSFHLGGVAATLLAAECAMILSGDAADALAGHELLVDVRHHRQFVTELRRNPGCRFDHCQWSPSPARGLTLDASFADALDAALEVLGGRGKVGFRVAGQRLAKALHCPGCGAMERRFHVVGRGGSRDCPRCQTHPLQVAGCSIVDRVDGSLPQELQRVSLRRAGLRTGDILVTEDARRIRYLVIGCDAARPAGGSRAAEPAGSLSRRPRGCDRPGTRRHRRHTR